MSKGEKHRKYTLEEKQEIVLDGEKNHLSNTELSKKYGIGKTTIRDWTRAYREKGFEGLSHRIPGKKNNVYTSDFRIAVVKEKLSGNISYSELGEKYNINKCVIQSWVYKYQEKGEESLIENNTGRAPKSNYPRTKLTKKEKEEITKIKEVYAELEHLRAEVAYLKKLNALTWEKEQFTKRKKLK